jgi:hypothetical protein
LEYTIETDHKRKLLIIDASGNADMVGFRNLIIELLKPPYVELSNNILLDFSSLDIGQLSERNVREINDLLAAEKSKLPPIKQAIVVGSTMSFGMARMFQIISEDALPLNTQVFKYIKEAVSWLNSSDKDSQT